jgi:hypothetical protein
MINAVFVCYIGFFPNMFNKKNYKYSLYSWSEAWLGGNKIQSFFPQIKYIKESFYCIHLKFPEYIYADLLLVRNST